MNNIMRNKYPNMNKTYIRRSNSVLRLDCCHGKNLNYIYVQD